MVVVTITHWNGDTVSSQQYLVNTCVGSGSLFIPLVSAT